MLRIQITKRSGLLSWLIALLVISNIPNSYAAPEILFNNPGASGCPTPYSSSGVGAQRFIARSSVTISSIEAYIGNGVQTNYSSARFFIMSNNSSSDVPLAIVETFTPSTISGTGAYTLGKFNGSYTASIGSKFWIVPGQAGTTFPWCYQMGASAATFTQNGMTVDTSTGLSNTNYRRAYLASGTVASGTWTSVNDGLGWQLVVNGNLNPSIVSVQLALQGGGSVATFNTATSLVSNVDQPSKVSFLANGKYIAGCKNKLSSGGTATCSWNPSIHGAVQLTARAVPIDVNYSAASAILSVGVIPRSNRR
jgi:hypothetical protein